MPVTDEQRAGLERLAASTSSPHRQVVQARGLLLACEGVANEEIARVRDHFGERVRYVFRHRPITGSDIARRAAELAERTRDSDSFWDAHVKLMTRSATLTEDDLVAVASDAARAGDRAGRPSPGCAARTA